MLGVNLAGIEDVYLTASGQEPEPAPFWPDAVTANPDGSRLSFVAPTGNGVYGVRIA